VQAVEATQALFCLQPDLFLEILQLVLVQDVVPFEMLAPTLHTGCVFRDIRFNLGRSPSSIHMLLRRTSSISLVSLVGKALRTTQAILGHISTA
jgi:hypothetical protein